MDEWIALVAVKPPKLSDGSSERSRSKPTAAAAAFESLLDETPGLVETNAEDFDTAPYAAAGKAYARLG